MRVTFHQFWGVASVFLYFATTALLIKNLQLFLESIIFLIFGPRSMIQFLFIHDYYIISLVVIGGTIGIILLWIPTTIFILKRSKSDILRGRSSTNLEKYSTFFGNALRVFGSVIAIFTVSILTFFALRKDTPGYDAPFSTDGEALLAEPFVRATDSIDGYSIHYRRPERLSLKWHLFEITPDRKARWYDDCLNPKRETTCEYFTNQHGLPTTAFTQKLRDYYRTGWMISLDENYALYFRAEQFERVYRRALPRGERSNVVEYIRVSNEIGRKIADSLRVDPTSVQD